MRNSQNTVSKMRAVRKKHKIPISLSKDRQRAEQTLNLKGHFVQHGWAREQQVKESSGDHISRSEGREAAQLAPNCQHLSPQKILLNKKATCQTRSSSPPLLSLRFPVSSVTALSPNEACHDSLRSVRRQQCWVCTPSPHLLLHSVYFSWSLFSAAAWY